MSPGTSFAENTLVSSDPADGSTVEQSPETITFSFSEELGEVNTITLTCDDLYTVGPRQVSDDRLTMTAEVIDPLPRGACVAAYVVSDSEGSPNGQGNITFNVANDAAPVETTPDTTPTTDSSVPSEATSASNR